MTLSSIDIIRSGFTILARDPEGFEADFQAILAQSAPRLRGLFTANPRNETRRLVAMLATAILNLDRKQTIGATAESLGRRNIIPGLKPTDYAVLGDALLATLAKRLGRDFTDAVSDVWRDAYVALSESMMAATYNRMHLAA